MQINAGLTKEIIDRYRTPVHIVSKDAIRNNCVDFSGQFRKYYPDSTFFFSPGFKSVVAIYFTGPGLVMFVNFGG